MSVVVHQLEDFIRNLPDLHAILPSFDTPYSKYCNTNYAAWGEDIHEIRKILSQQEQQIYDLSFIIKTVKNLLKELQEIRGQISSSRKAHQGFISSGVRRLPSEILRKIFVLCLPPEVYIKPEKRTAPLLLTWICRRWREIALGTPKLWRSLSIQPFSWIPELRLHLYNGWLSNARAHPLSVHVDTISSRSDWRDGAIRLLRPFTSRCEQLTINFNRSTRVDLLLEDVPMLKCLTLDGHLNALRNVSITQSQPCLRTLVVSSQAFDVDILSVFNPGWTNLTRLSVLYPPESQIIDDSIFFALLRTCINLEHFMFSSFFFSEENPVSLTHPKLCSLAIAEVFDDGPMLDTLMLPNLRDLSFGPFKFDIEFKITPSPFGNTSTSEDVSMAGNGQGMCVAPPQTPICSISIVNLCEVPSNVLLTSFNFEWVNLTRLRVDVDENESIFLLLLQRCANLEDLDIRFITVRRFKDPHLLVPPSSFTHLKLRSLDIGIRADVNRRLFSIVILPNLHSLSMAFCDGVSWSRHHTQFKVFFSRSSCPLETLNIRGSRTFKEEHREELSALIPTLKHLEAQAASD